jgi:hypothetical protein
MAGASSLRTDYQLMRNLFSSIRGWICQCHETLQKPLEKLKLYEPVGITARFFLHFFMITQYPPVTGRKNFPCSGIHPRHVQVNKLGKKLGKLGKTPLALGKKWGMYGKKHPEKIRFTNLSLELTVVFFVAFTIPILVQDWRVDSIARSFVAGCDLGTQAQ